MVGQAIGVASFPVLAHLYSEKRLDELNNILNATMKGLILLLVPTAALTIAQSVPLVHLVFSHTRLHETDLLATAGLMLEGEILLRAGDRKGASAALEKAA